jgi:SAM-dependent methyltransferase
MLTALDIGGRYQPYRALFDQKIGSYISLDLIRTDKLSVVGNAEHLPFARESFDLVIAMQVFEYFTDPCATARQVHDVLKPGGVLLASFAACAPRFVDGENWRFTRSGLRLMLSPFETVEIVPEVHSVGSVLRTVNLGFDTFVKFAILRQLYQLTACPVLNLVALGLENLKLTSNDQFTTNYSVKAVKKSFPKS